MKPRYLILLILGMLPNAWAEAGDYIEVTNTDESYATTSFQHEISSINTGTEGGELWVLYDKYQATCRGDVYIRSLTGTGNFNILGTATCSQNVFHLEHAEDFSGNIHLTNFCRSYDTEGKYNNSAILEYAGGCIQGSVSLATAINGGSDSHFIVAFGLSGDTILGGLDSSEQSASSAWLYSGALKAGSTSLRHETPFTDHLALAEHTLTIDTDGEHAFHGSLAGPLKILKQGTGSQSFIGHFCTGLQFCVQDGFLSLQSEHTEASGISVTNGARLEHIGKLTTTTLTLQGGTLEVSGALTATTATFSGSNTLSAQSCSGETWYFTLSSGDSPILTLSGTAEVDTLEINYTAADVARGWFTLVEGGEFSASSILINGQTAQIEQTTAGLRVYVNDGAPILPRPGGSELLWQGSSGTWQTSSGHLDQSWAGPASNSNFETGDYVIFNHAAQVSLAGELLPSQVEVNNDSGTVEFTGSGYLSGATGIVKSGSGELLIRTANTHSGHTTLSGGSVVVANDAALGSGDVLMQGGTLNLQGYAVSNTLKVQGDARLHGAQTYNGRIELQSGRLSTETLGAATLSCTGAAELIADGTLGLNSSIENTGELTLQGTFDITALAVSISPTMVDAWGNTGGSSGFVRDAGCEARITTGGSSGFARNAGGCESHITTGGMLHAEDATLLLHGQRVEADSSGYASLPGTTHLDQYLITEEHSVSTAQIEAAAGNKLRRISQQGGTLLVNTETDTLQAEAGLVRLEYARLHGGLGGSARLETAHQAELGGANTYSGGTTITSGSLKLLHAQALGTGSVKLLQGSTLDFNHFSVSNHMHVSGQARLRNPEAYLGNINLARGAKLSIDAGSQLTLHTGQALTLAEGGNSISGMLHLDGGTIVFKNAPLTLSGRLTIGSASTLDLREWQNVQKGDTLLQLDAPTVADVSQLTLLLPNADTEYTAAIDSQTGNLILMQNDNLPQPTLPAELNRNQQAVFQALANAIEAKGELQELRQKLYTTTDASALRQLLNHAAHVEYATLLPSLMNGNLAHMRMLRQNMGEGHLLKPQGNTTVAMHAFTHRNSATDYQRCSWGGRLQMEQHPDTDTLWGLALSAGYADTTPDDGAPLSENFTNIDAYTQLRDDGWQFSFSAGISIHELAPSGNLGEGASATGINISSELLHEITLTEQACLRPFVAVTFTQVQLDAIREAGGSAAIQISGQSSSAAEISVGAHCTFLLDSHTTLQIGSAISGFIGNTAPGIDVHFEGAPTQGFTLKPARSSVFAYELSAGITHQLSPDTTLHAGGAARLGDKQNELHAQAGILLHF